MKRILKSSLLLLFIILVAGVQQISAQSLKEFFSSSEVPLTYLGIDFTKAKILNDITANAADIKNRLYAGINQVTVNEPKKYDFEKSFSRSTVNKDISLVVAKNNKIDAEKIIESGGEAPQLTKKDVESIVKGYDFGSKKGIALLFIMETMNKATSEASMFVTLIDMSGKKVLLAEKMVGKGGGIGFRNFWVKTIDAVLNDIEKTKYKEWKSAN
ncbi:MAG: hypothetical protein IT249_10185 [Chitinophagaceae bacterium]|nr:hypothetical protein [Chitinophagaceae bacterium]